MELQALRLFREVARTGSLLSASKNLHYAQSYLSAKIRQLESELGVQLFYRSNRGVTLTLKGRQLMDYADQLLGLAEQAESAMRDEGTAQGVLAIGAVETITQTAMPRLLSRYHQDAPQVRLTVSAGTSADLMAAVCARTLDAAFLYGNTIHPDLITIPFCRERLVLACSAAQTELESFAQLQGQTLLVFQQGGYYRTLLEQLMREQQLIAGDLVEFDSLNGIIANLCAGLGVSLLSEALLDQSAQRVLLQTLPLPAPYSDVPVFLAYRKDRYQDAAFSHFLQLVWREKSQLET